MISLYLIFQILKIFFSKIQKYKIQNNLNTYRGSSCEYEQGDMGRTVTWYRPAGSLWTPCRGGERHRRGPAATRRPATRPPPRCHDRSHRHKIKARQDPGICRAQANDDAGRVLYLTGPCPRARWSLARLVTAAAPRHAARASASVHRPPPRRTAFERGGGREKGFGSVWFWEQHQ